VQSEAPLNEMQLDAELDKFKRPENSEGAISGIEDLLQHCERWHTDRVNSQGIERGNGNWNQNQDVDNRANNPGQRLPTGGLTQSHPSSQLVIRPTL